MSRVIKRNEPILAEIELSLPQKFVEMWPVTIPFAASLVFVLARAYGGERGFLYEGALTVLALICYMSAAVVMVTNLFVKERVLRRLGLFIAVAGATFNLSGWMIRWIEAGDAEGWKSGINGIWRYVPLDNLYPLTLGFCFGAAITTLAIVRKPRYEFVGALSMPMTAVILTLAILLGNHISTLPPILDSYWRPIHVSVATLGYGVCLVSFGLAFAYLLKDGVRSEAIAIWVGLFGILIYGTVGRFAVPFYAEYGSSLFVGKSSLPVRATLPWVGPFMALTLLAISAAVALFVIDRMKQQENLRRWGWRLFRSAVVLQAIAIAALFFQVKTIDNPASRIPAREMAGFGQWLATEMDMNIAPTRYSDLAGQWVAQNSADLTVSLKSNPVEIGGMLALFVALVIVSLFAWRREDVIGAMPSLQSIDSLLYKTVGVAFPLLTLLLITGAVWANESWGRYWGWDPKEVGALVAWLAYAGFLHTRISHGWRGRRSAYFALLGFALVIFTWLGVSYLLPGLHSYA